MARRVSREEGILIGGSGGHGRRRGASRSAKAARTRRHRRRAQPRLRPRLPVAGLRRRVDGQLRLPARVRRCASARCSTPAAATCRRSLYVNPDDTVRDADRPDARPTACRQLPVCKNTPPFAAAEVSGAVDELELMEAVHPRPGAMLDTPVEKVMGPKLPTIGVGQPVALAVEMLDSRAGAAGAVRRPPARAC